MNCYRYVVIVLLTILSFSSFAIASQNKKSGNDLCKWAKDYYGDKKFDRGDEILELHAINANRFWVSYSGKPYCNMEFSKVTRKCDKILVKDGDTECIFGNSVFRIPNKATRSPANN